MRNKASAPVGTRISPAERIRAIQMTMFAAATGIMSGIVAYVLYYLIVVVGNYVYFQRYDPDHLPRMQYNNLGLWVILIPAEDKQTVHITAGTGTAP